MLDFFIAGVQKSGTTALDRYLRQHPQIQMAARKETHFFDDERLDWMTPDYGRLHQEFDWRVERVRGEATPIYTYWPGSLERIRSYNPQAKLIILLRHPTFRAFSHWRMEVSRSHETLDFASAITIGRRRVGAAHRIFSYVERGFYSRQVANALKLFPRRQVLFLRTDNLWAHPGETLASVYRFLEVEPVPAPSRSYITPVPTIEGAAMASASRALLDNLYREDILRTSDMLAAPLSEWLRPDYTEPSRR